MIKPQKDPERTDDFIGNMVDIVLSNDERFAQSLNKMSQDIAKRVKQFNSIKQGETEWDNAEAAEAIAEIAAALYSLILVALIVSRAAKEAAND